MKNLLLIISLYCFTVEFVTLNKYSVILNAQNQLNKLEF